MSERQRSAGSCASVFVMTMQSKNSNKYLIIIYLLLGYYSANLSVGAN